MKFKRNNKRRIVANVEMTPLIDVVFQLLIFFMLSSTFVVQTSIPVEIPESEGATKMEHRGLTIALFNVGTGGPDDGGKIEVDEVVMESWEELASTLAEFKQRKPDEVVLLAPDKQVSYDRIVKVLSIASNVGIERYGLAAKPPPSEE